WGGGGGGETAARRPGGGGELSRVEVTTDLRRVVLAERVGRGLESSRVPGLDRLARPVDDACLRVVQRTHPSTSLRVVEAVVQGLLERLLADAGPRHALVPRPVGGLAPDSEFVNRVRHGPPSYAGLESDGSRERRAELRGRLKHASLLTPTDQEAGAPQLVAGAGYAVALAGS